MRDLLGKPEPAPAPRPEPAGLPTRAEVRAELEPLYERLRVVLSPRALRELQAEIDLDVLAGRLDIRGVVQRLRAAAEAAGAGGAS